MGEIKSTLDLVMEKTRHLTLSKEEKMIQNRLEVKGRLQGLIQKYQDNLLKKENLKKEINDLKVSYDLNVDEMLANLLIDSFELGQDHTLFLDLLGEIYGLDLTELKTIFQNFKAAVKSSAEERVERIKGDLYKKRFISGSAVVPNLERDKEWRSTLSYIKEGYDKILNKTKSDLIKDLSLD
jgi:hypothetical protein